MSTTTDPAMGSSGFEGHDTFGWRSAVPWAACAVPMGMLAAMVAPAPVAYGLPQDGWADGPPASGFRPDTSDHTYCWGNGFEAPKARDASVYAATNLDNQTAMTTSKIGCTSLTDAVWLKTGDPGVDGSYTCVEFNSAGECERALTRLNPSNMSSDSDWKQSACHELGHSVGLTHKNGSCLGTDPSVIKYSSHHVDHVNCKCDNP